MISLERIFQSIQTYNQKIHTYLNVYENLNFTNYTKWCNEIKQEIADRWRLNHIIVAPPKDPQWKQDNAQVMSWILYTLDTTIINAVLDHSTSAHDLWTWIHSSTLLLG